MSVQQKKGVHRCTTKRRRPYKMNIRAGSVSINKNKMAAGKKNTIICCEMFQFPANNDTIGTTRIESIVINNVDPKGIGVPCSRNHDPSSSSSIARSESHLKATTQRTVPTAQKCPGQELGTCAGSVFANISGIWRRRGGRRVGAS